MSQNDCTVKNRFSFLNDNINKYKIQEENCLEYRGFVGQRAEYRQDGQSILESCLQECFGQIGCIVRQQNMRMKRSGMRMMLRVARRGDGDGKSEIGRYSSIN